MKSKFIFVKVEKHFKGGFKEVIIPVIKTRYEGYTEAEIIEEVAKEWGEDSDGGHNCGYQIKWSKAKDKVKINEAVNLRIIKARKEIDDYEKQIKNNEEEIKLLTEENKISTDEFYDNWDKGNLF